MRLQMKGNIMHCILDNSKICDDCGECHFCDLDPDKICDNCCKCIQQDDADKIEIPLNKLYKAMEQQTVPENDEFIDEMSDFEDTEAYDGSMLDPLEIDPALLNEWEARLAELEEPGQPPAPGKNLHGVRRRK